MSKLTAIPVAALMFAVWAVFLGGLASLQSSCSDNGTSNMVGVTGIDANLPCHKVYRLYWFYASYEIFVIVLIAAAAVTGRVMHMSSGLTGLLAVALVMYIQASNTFLSAEDQPYYDEGTPLHRIRTVTAGAIMTAAMNGIAILALGFVHSPLERHVVEKPVAAVAV